MGEDATLRGHIERQRAESSGHGGVFILAFGVFAVGTGEFVLAGLLPLFSRALEVSVAAAGQVITVFALTCAIAAPVLTTLTAAWPRRRVLISAAMIYLVGAVGTALASSYTEILVAQIVAAAGVGLYVPNASVTAAALVPPERRGRAIAIVVTGFTAAVALGAPLGTALGGLLGWRATMWFAAGIAVLGVVGLLFVPRHVGVEVPSTMRDRLRPLADRRVLPVLGTTLVGFTAVFIPYTYIGVIFEPATMGDSVHLAGLMFTLGVVGAIGNFAAGALADRLGGPRVVTGALIWLTVSMLILPLTTGSLGAAFAMIAFYALAAFAITTPQQHRLISMRPESAPVLVSLNQAILYLAIAMSGLAGGVGIGWIGAQYLSFLAAALALAALALSECGRWFAQKRDSGLGVPETASTELCTEPRKSSR